MNPQNILLIKSHSMGIGDVLRSSAAWLALKQRWPEAHLHLLFLSRHPGYPTEQLIREHPLLASAHFITVTTDSPDSGRSQRLPRKQVYRSVAQAVDGLPIDMVIDFEPGGLRTSLLTHWIARRKQAVSFGIAQFPLRRWFYSHASPSVPDYIRRHGLAKAMDYTEKDFVALAALGIERTGRNITMSVTQAGQRWQIQNMPAVAKSMVLTLNIGCGTSGALPKRPKLDALVAGLVAIYRERPFVLHLSGADFERQVNADFRQAFDDALATYGLKCEVNDWSGQCSLSELTGLLGASDLVISSDSGPYHMAVALGIPTVCWFNFDTPPSYHQQTRVRCVIQPTPDQVVLAAEAVLSEV